MRFSYGSNSIYYQKEGQGPVLLFLHGLGGNSSNWIYQRKYFQNHRTVISVDLPGHGQSEGSHIRFHEYWEVIASLLEHLNISSCTICGLSKGARVGLDLAFYRPEMIDGLIMVNSFVRLRSDDRVARMNIYGLLDLDDGGEQWSDVLLREMGVLEYPAIVRGFKHSLKTMNRKHVQQLFYELADVDQRDKLERLNCPVLVIRGVHDHFVPEFYANEINHLVKQSEIVVMEHCGHLPYLEKSADFNHIVDAFLLRREGD
ncbi:alpha/beta hydrolase [Paenibacillus sp. SC116]|uniref:alpha/beta fold hydrolase n=1 Tax=Paenibacillus sp. SC116 TaxID=2968986 RepID=UPI00215B388C|nr:alpha/beta hydrolase [Paenibacillus sp. SC116]MCR8842104.1 alpha/beta hydrolase [Paenibacillus sp. SC116]